MTVSPSTTVISPKGRVKATFSTSPGGVKVPREPLPQALKACPAEVAADVLDFFSQQDYYMKNVFNFGSEYTPKVGTSIQSGVGCALFIALAR
jgi:hypothetical protein